MEQVKNQSNNRSLLMRLALVVFDIVAVNLSYFIALVVRFYVHSEFNELAMRYIPAFRHFAPFYTVGCLVIFYFFKMYNSRWKYAGLGDMNRIVYANLLAFLLQVVGSMVFVMRMPVTYYLIGAVVQFTLTTIIRFAPRIILVESERAKTMNRKDDAAVNVMVVGVGETSHVVLRQMERNPEGVARPVCLVDFRSNDSGDVMQGVPVIGGVDKIDEAVKKYNIGCVILADTTMPDSIRKQVREICAKQEVEVREFTGYLQESSGSMTLRTLLSYTKGEVEVVLEGEHHVFANGEQAALAMTGKYLIKSVAAKESRLVVELQKDILVPNDLKEDWVRSYEKESGEDISFF